MRRIAVAVLAVVVALGLSASVMAQDAPKEKPRATKVVGQLTKIADKALTITTKDGDKSTDTVITANEKTRVTQQGDSKRGTPAKFEDLKVGQEVTAYYNAEKIAVGVMIMKAEAPK